MRNLPDWSDGYITDLEYTYSFFRELSPENLRFAALYAGYRPAASPPRHGKFVYCELGCGNGVSTNIFASAHPEGQFFGIDYNPSHIAFASGLARQAELDNINFLEADFRHLDKEDIPPCDFIICHGIYSWVSQENQAAIRKFVRDKLKPGGIFYISYNCLPGWAAAAPIQHLYRLFGQSALGDILQRVPQAMEKFDQAFATGKGYFALQKPIESKINEIKKHDKVYVAHEYFNQNWNLFYHTDIVQQFQEAKVAYAGSATLFDSYLENFLGEQERQILNQYKDQGMRETLKDYFINRNFRKDLFIRGPLPLSSREKSRLLFATKFCLNIPREAFSLEMTLSGVKVEGKPDIYLPIADALAQSPKTLEELVNLVKQEPSVVLQTMCYLLDSAQVSIAADPLDKKARTTIHQMNLAILEQALYAKKLNIMVCPDGRTGVGISWLNQLFIKALLEKQPPAQVVWQAMLAFGERMANENGQPLETEEENLAAIHAKFSEFEKIRPQVCKVLGLE